MEKLKETLAQWRVIEPVEVSLGRIRRDPALQPREPSVVPFVDRGRQESEAERHIDTLKEALTDGPLEPLLVAEVDEKLLLVDGHHRLMAHRRAGSNYAPVRIHQSTREEALMISKLVNCDGVKLPMHPEQARECAWQYLAMITERGTQELPKGASKRLIGRTFGTSRETIGSMVKALPLTKAEEFPAIACDPGTRWPRWKYVKGNAIRDRFADLPEDVREQQKDERRAAKLAAIIEKDGMDAFLRSIRLLQNEALTEAVVALAGDKQELEDNY